MGLPSIRRGPAGGFLAALLLLWGGCAAPPERAAPRSSRPAQVAALPFAHWKGPYFGESCRREFVERARPLFKKDAVFVPPEQVRAAIRDLTGREDFELSDSSGAAVARALGADLALFGVCKLQSAGIRLVEPRGERVLLDAVAPIQGTNRDYALAKLARRAADGWPCLDCPAAASGAARGYARPKSVAVLPVVDETGQPSATAPIRALCDEAFKLKGLRTAEPGVVDERLKSVFGIMDGNGLKTAVMADVAKALEVDAVAVLRLNKAGAPRDRRVGIELTVLAPSDGVSWTAAGLGGKRGVALSSQEALQDSFVDKAEKLLVGPLATPYRSEIALAFDVIWRQLPSWLQ
ncbi:MAG: hypothetical protein WC969_01010 [Elusimicrobiota bacterium]|jgi:hypothetical protein